MEVPGDTEINSGSIPLILSSILFNYVIGSKLAKSKDNNGAKKKGKQISRKSILTLGIVANLGLLGYFKYTDFFLSNINLLFLKSIKLMLK